MSLDLRPRVVEPIGEREELLADPHGLLELGPVDEVRREPAQHGEQLRELALRFAQLQRALVRMLGLGCEALRRHQDAGQARLQQDLLEETLLVLEGVDESTSRRSVMSVAVSWYQPRAL